MSREVGGILGLKAAAEMRLLHDDEIIAAATAVCLSGQLIG